MAKQQEEAQERQRIEQELRVARLIEQTLLPKMLPGLPGYDVAAYYQPPARWAATSTTSFNCRTAA